MHEKKKDFYATIVYNSPNDVRVITLEGTDVTSQVKERTLQNARELQETRMFMNEHTGLWTRQIHMKLNNIEEFEQFFKDVEGTTPKKPLKNIKPNNDPVFKFLQTCYEKKPDELMMDELKWKYLCRNVMRSKNIMLVGPTGTGKTFTAQCLAKAMAQPYFYCNLGATQDPRGTLIGNTHFKKDTGTFFSTSLFVKAIQTENAIILLDELSRAHPEAWNILMTVLDEGQRYLRLDEQDGSPTIKVAKGVSFIATANVGSQYTSTRIMDRALYDRFTIVEVQPLDQSQEISMLTKLFPNLDKDMISKVAEIAALARMELNQETPRINVAISTRSTKEMCSLLEDGFSLYEAAEVAIYPFYDASGGAQSERTYVKQLIQRFI